MPAGKYGVRIERSAPLRLPVHSDTPRSQSWRRWALGQTRPRAIDLFSGCGGLGLGLQSAGYTVILSVDNDPWALETHRHNLPGVALDLDLSEPGRVDSLVRLLSGIPIHLVAGGPPCQPFSRAGRSKLRSLVREGARPARDNRTELWQSFWSSRLSELAPPPAAWRLSSFCYTICPTTLASPLYSFNIWIPNTAACWPKSWGEPPICRLVRRPMACASKLTTSTSFRQTPI